MKIMNEIFSIVFAFATGLVLGVLFFGGLWLTVKRISTAKMPGFLFFGSFLLRTGIILIGFYYVSAGNWQRLIVCLIGFVAARFIVSHFTKINEEKKLPLKKEIIHET